MKITVIGRGRLGGGLADLWDAAGHQITRLGRDGGHVGSPDVVLLAVPGQAVEQALSIVDGIAGKTVIDATNLFAGGPPKNYRSTAEFVKSVTGGPTAKAFNTNFAALFQELSDIRARPSNLWCGDDEVESYVSQLSLDAGFEAVRLGDLRSAAVQESLAGTLIAIAQSGLGEFVYRMAPPDQL